MNDLFSDSINQLNKLSIRKMNYRITQINIDFEDDNFELSPTEQQSIIEDVMSTTWEASDGDDLVERLHLPQDFALILSTTATF